MSIAIAYFVGGKYGHWAIGAERFATEAHAQRYIDGQYWREKAAEITPIYRKAVDLTEQARRAA